MLAFYTVSIQAKTQMRPSSLKIIANNLQVTELAWKDFFHSRTNLFKTTSSQAFILLSLIFHIFTFRMSFVVE
jgi:hypothetical protein